MCVYIYICFCVWCQGSAWGWRAYVAPGFGAEVGSGFSVGLGVGCGDQLYGLGAKGEKKQRYRFVSGIGPIDLTV